MQRRNSQAINKLKRPVKKQGSREQTDNLAGRVTLFYNLFLNSEGLMLSSFAKHAMVTATGCCRHQRRRRKKLSMRRQSAQGEYLGP